MTAPPPVVDDVALLQLESEGGQPDGEPEDSSGYVTFALAGELFAFPMSRVKEIIRMPSVVRVPLSPYSLDGLANLRGHILPVVDLRRSCGLPAADHDDATRVIVVNCGVSLGVVVDRVAAVLSVEPDEVQDVSSIRTTLDSDLLTSVLRPAGTDDLVAVLDIQRIVETQFPLSTHEYTDLETAVPGATTRDVGTAAPDDEASADTVELVSFVVDGQEYALPIQQVQEIVQSPESVSHVPNSDPRVMGVMDLRGALLPVVSLRRIFNLPQDDLRRTNRVVVVPLEEEGSSHHVAVGVVMDTVREVLRVPRDVVDQLPGFLARSGQVAEVESVCRLEGGARVVSILSAQRLFAGKGLRAALDNQLADLTAVDVQEESVSDETTEVRSVDAPVDTEEQLVVFRMDADEYCVDVDAVQEIIRVPEQLIKVPRALDFVEGLVNLRGSVLPVVDLRTRLGLARAPRDDRQRIVVLIIGGFRTGFIVDSVVEVTKLERSLVEPAPDLLAQHSEMISEVANLTESRRMLLILRPDRLLGGKEIEALREPLAA